MRRSQLFLLLLCLTISLSFCARLTSANVALSIDEAATRMGLRNGHSEVSLAVRNPTNQEYAAHITCELLDTMGRVRASIGRVELIRRGTEIIRLPLAPPLTGANEETLQNFLWHRLRYRVVPVAGAPVGSIEGIISLSEITPDFFELRVSAPPYGREGANYHARVYAAHPISGRAVGGVNLAAEIKFDSDVAPVTAAGVTGADGYAAFEFSLPRKVKTNDARLKISGSLGDFNMEAEGDVRFFRSTQILISTDKTLYQPGQTLHLRALIFDSQKRAVPATPLTLTISDPEYSKVFRSELVTSRFGVASVDWQIPDGTRLGDYQVKIETGDESLGESNESQTIRISRYELPNFAVNPKPDRTFYLPGQNAEIEVRADYLFGKPVTKGHVRVVRETERTWDYKNQKWETKEAEEYAGETDEKGQFTARVNLAEEHLKLSRDEYSKYQDLSYAAYFTDPTTNRTEQRRFDLRVTKEAIHVYVLKDNRYQTNGFPTQFFVTTAYADGTPAAGCQVLIKEGAKTASSSSPTNRGRSNTGFFLDLAHASPALSRRVATNRFGVAKVSNLMLLGLEDGTDDVSLKLSARDSKGLTGTFSEAFEHTDKAVVRVTTDKILFRKGEALKAVITASQLERTVIVDVVSDWRVLHSETVRLHNGHAVFSLPYNDQFKGAVSIVAYSDAEKAYEQDRPLGTRTVIYPKDEDLKLKVRMERGDYRPGEEARAEFQVTTSDGRPVESALGIAVFDRAVEERARTDSEFGASNRFGFNDGRGEAIAGLRLQDFERYDRKLPLPAGMEVVGEILLHHAQRYYPTVFDGDRYSQDARRIFENLIGQQLQPVRNALDTRYAQKAEYPTDEPSLARILSEAGVDFAGLRDPWGTPYRASLDWAREHDVTNIKSAGADKRFGTGDDFTALQIKRPYFLPFGEKINRVLENYYTRTGGFIHDAATLKSELRQAGVDFDALRDRRGNPYTLEFGITGTNFYVMVKSSDAKASYYDSSGVYTPPGFTVWTGTTFDYFAATRARINDALSESLKKNRRAPLNEAELREALREAGIDWDALRDLWGHRYQVRFKSWVENLNSFVILNRARYGEPLHQQVVNKLNSHQFYYISLHSGGKDGVVGTGDDFAVAGFYRSTAELEHSLSTMPKRTAGRFVPYAPVIPNPANLQGLVFDPNQARIVGAAVKAINTITGIVTETTTDEEGFYRLTNLNPANVYIFEVTAPGFAHTVIEQVPFYAGVENVLNVSLGIGSLAETVMISGGAPLMIQSTQSQLSQTYSPRQLTSLPFNGRIDNLSLLTAGIVTPGDADFANGVGISANGSRGRSNNFQIDGQDNSDNSVRGQISTPRLREYFPETLVWQPSLETDASGHAQLSFKLADNITTWKMSVIGSTVDGEIGIVTQEIRAFQPFFVEHDPPRVLTEGDQIQLPVVLRNYLSQPQKVAVEIKPESWFTLLGAAQTQETVAAGDATRAIFGFRADASIKDGKQRITATAQDASDAIEKPVSVHPDGEEITLTGSHHMNETATLDVNFPADAIKGSNRAELKIYPNLMAHVIESIEGIMKRPYGCGEQTISSTYPSLLALKAHKRSGLKSQIEAKAARYLRAGYERLLNYRVAGGGFSYWGRGDADLALTGYALRFLTEAREFTSVDENVLAETREWLGKQQRADGSWAAYQYSSTEDAARTAMLTAYISRVLALSNQDAMPESNNQGEAQMSHHAARRKSPETALLTRALDYLQRHEKELREPYILSAYVLASLASSEDARATLAVEKLRALVQDESDSSFWQIETSTPFHGWGLAGRLETTALTVQALSQFAATERGGRTVGNSALDKSAQSNGRTSDALAARGLLYLLKQKDRYGVWHSTQATVNVLDALISAMSAGSVASGAVDSSAQESEAEIFVNDKRATSVTLPAANALGAPVTVNLSQYLTHGNNRLTIRRAEGSAQAALQLVQSYYVPWSSLSSSVNASQAQRTLRLSVSYDKSNAETGAQVTCRVEAERLSGGGYGMMLAEIGLPPGADVDRASLEEAMKKEGWSLSRYDVLPDKLIVYLWPRMGGTRFDFKFRLRYGLSAQTAPSVIYDYYNPEARAVIAPTKFNVK